MQGITNATSTSSGGNKEIKVLNVVQNGSLYRSDGTKFTDFSASNYLTIGGVVQNGIFSQSENILSFSQFFSTANTWEVNGSFTLGNVTADGTILVSNQSATGLYISCTNGIVSFSGWNSSSIFSFSLSITANTKYYFRIIFSGEDYKVYVNTDGETYDNTTLLGTETTIVKLADGTPMTIGIKLIGGTNPISSDSIIDLIDWNIKKNGEYWWKGVETL